MNSRWTIEMFGGLCACQDEERITRFATQKTASLLAYLAFYRTRTHSREVLIELLWPECEPGAGRTRLSTLLSHLRHLLEPPGTLPASVVQADRISVRLNPDALTTDAAEFERLLQVASQTQAVAKRLPLLQSATSLYKGELLPGSYETWVGREQTHLRDRFTQALQDLGLAWEQTGEIETALTTIERAIQADPYREATHRTRMRLQAALGRPAAVQESYRAVEQLFRQELGAGPSAATRELAARLRSDPRAVVTAREAPQRVASPVAPPPASEKPRIASPVPDDAPATSGEEMLPSTLPLQMTRFFGRASELAQLQQLLEETDTRLVTLLGSGGAGKTRLAIETARRLAPGLRNRVWFVPLADLPDAHLLGYALARALNLPVTGAADPLEPVLALLNEAPCLLALDNFEHLLREDAPAYKGDQILLDKGTALVRLLLERAPSLRCLVTSRRALRLTGEQEFPLAPLPLPALSSVPEEVLASASAALYVDRAKRARPDFAVTVNNAHAVAQLCQRLEGIPLAIEMAAAWAKTLTPARMLERLEERLDALTSRQRDLPARHQSLRATIDWSYDLLDAPQQRLLARLCVFRGGWTLEAAERICADVEPGAKAEKEKAEKEEAGSESGGRHDEASESPPAIAEIAEGDVLDLLSALVEKSLVVSEEVDGEIRYRLLEMVRRYSQDRLKASGESDEVQARHYAFFLAMAAVSWDKINTGEQIACLDSLEREQDNMRAALAWACTREGRQSSGSEAELDLAGRLYSFWHIRGYWREGREILKAALARDTDHKVTEVRARSLFGAGILAANLGDYAAAREHYEACLTIRRQLGEKESIGRSMVALGNTASMAGDFAAAHRWYAEGLEVARELGDDGFLASVLGNLGVLAKNENDEAAHRRYGEECLTLYRKNGDRQGIALAQCSLSTLYAQQRDFPAAYASLCESLTLSRDLGHKRIIRNVLGVLAEAEAVQGRAASSARLWGGVRRLMEETGTYEETSFHEYLSALRQELGNAVFEAALTQGHAIGVEQAIEDALTILQHDSFAALPEPIASPGA